VLRKSGGTVGMILLANSGVPAEPALKTVERLSMGQQAVLTSADERQASNLSSVCVELVMRAIAGFRDLSPLVPWRFVTGQTYRWKAGGNR